MEFFMGNFYLIFNFNYKIIMIYFNLKLKNFNNKIYWILNYDF